VRAGSDRIEPVPDAETSTIGQPRTALDARLLARFDQRMRLPIIVSAVLPLVVVPSSGTWIGIAVGVVTWLVFLVDYLVHQRRTNGFLRTRYGKFDLFIVVATAPWFLLPGASGGSFVVLLRLARLARLMVASRSAHRLFVRLGRVAGVALAVMATASLVAYYAEHPVNPEFATVGDAFWWGIVTLTTVGYGDVVPITTTGRLAGVAIMLTGIAVLGLLAGSMASFFRLDPADDATSPAPPSATPSAPDLHVVISTLTDEVASLREEVRSLVARLDPPRAGDDTDP
jgi:voltage-gated potassium channel